MVSKDKIADKRPVWLDVIEGGGVFIALPFLMFPTIKPVVTFLCLVGLCSMWILSIFVHHSPWPQTPFNGVMLLFFIMTGVGAGVSAFPDLSLPKTTGLIIGFAIWRLVTLAINNQTRLRWAVIGFLLLCIGMTAAGIMATDWPTETPILSKVFYLFPDRLISLPEQTSTKLTNQLGGAILIYYPLVLSAVIAALYKRSQLYKIVGLINAAAVITGLLILTQSRSTWISALISIFCVLFIWCALSPPSRMRTVLWGLAISMVLALLITLLMIGPMRLLEILREPIGMTAFGKLDTLVFRQKVWRWAVTAVADFPFTGCGLGTFRRVVTILYPLNVLLPDIAHAHNIFLQVALDVGIPGLIAYVALLGLMVVVALRVAMRGEYRALAIGILCGTIALHIYGLLDALALGSKPAIAFWYSLGLLSALDRLSDKDLHSTVVTAHAHTGE